MQKVTEVKPPPTVVQKIAEIMRLEKELKMLTEDYNQGNKCYQDIIFNI